MLLSGSYIVDTVVDESDGDFSEGDLSLREAIEQANANSPSSESITFDASLAGSTILLEMGELEITDSVTIVGLGADQLTVSGGSESRVFSVASGDVTLAHFSIEDGLAQGGQGGDSEFGGGGGGGAGMGGGIFVNTGASVLAQNLILRGNQAVGGDGGDAGVPGAGTSTVTGGFDSTGGAAGTSSFVDGNFGLGGAGGAGTTVDGESGSAGGSGNFGAGGGGGGGGGFNGSSYLAGGGGDRGFLSEDFANGNASVVRGIGNGKAGSDGLDGAVIDENDSVVINPDIPAGTGGGGGGGAGLGGAIFVRSGGSLTVVDSHFEANQARGGEPGRRGDGVGAGLGGAIFAMDTVTVNQYGTTFGHGSLRANTASTPGRFPSSPASTVEQRQGLFGTFSRNLPSLSYVDGPDVPEFLEYSYLDPGVRNPNGVIAEDVTKTTVSEILNRLGRGGLREEVPTPTAIAVTSLDSSNGRWQVNGETISGLSETNALLLDGDDVLQFIVNENFATYSRDHLPSLTFRAWDGTGGQSGDLVNTTTNGSGTPFSTTIATAVVEISDPILFQPPVDFFGGESTLFRPTDAYFPQTYGTAAFPTTGSGEFLYTITGVGGVWASGPSVTSNYAVINPGTSPNYRYGYSGVRLGTIQHSSMDASSTGPGNVSQSIYNSNVRIGNFVATNQDSGPIPIIRSQTARDAGATHFQVIDIEGGTLYRDADFTQAISDGEFVSYENGNVWLYFRPETDFTGDATFYTLDSTTDNDSGLLAGDSILTGDNPTKTLAITRENLIATHLKVSDITNGSLYLDEDLTEEVTNGSFIKFSSDTITLYFTPERSKFGSEASVTLQESSTNADSGLLGDSEIFTVTVPPQHVVSVHDSIIKIESITTDVENVGQTIRERDSGTTVVDFVVSRGSISGGLPEATYNYEVTSDEADGEDFIGGELPTGTVTFEANQSQAIISIELARDAEIEEDEEFTISLSGLPTSGFDLSQTSTSVVITNDDADLVVDALGDEDDGNFSEGNRTLREAIRVANLREGADEITFHEDLMGETIFLENGRLEITDDVTLTGLGADQLTIDAQSNHQIVFADGRTNDVIDVTISGVTLTGGYANDVGGGTSAAINNAIRGGAIFNDLANLTLSNSILSNNSADGNGGGIYNLGGNVDISASTLSGNSAFAQGGGIYNDGTLHVLGSTLAGNTAGFNGAGIYSSGGTTVTNSTLSGNAANNDGGGIYNVDEIVVLANATLTGNRADADGADGGTGGGIWTFDDNATFTLLVNSIVAGNVQGTQSSDTANDIANKDVVGSSTNNLIGDPNSAGGLTHGSVSNIVGQDDGNDGRELLDISTVLDTTLADNGGPTQTHSLVTGSPAVNGGNNDLATTPGDDGIPGSEDDNETALTTDQRGEGFDRILDGTVDIGAYEFLLPATLSIAADSASVNEGDDGTTQLTFTVTLSKSHTDDITFDLTTVSGTAESGSDFTAKSGQGTITAGETSTTITVDIIGDTTVEADENFTVRISNVSTDGLDVEFDSFTFTVGELSLFSDSGNFENVEVVNDIAYVAASSQGLKILDVSDPENVSLLGSFGAGGNAIDLQIEGGVAYIANRDDGLQVLDVSDPTDISLLGSFDTAGLAREVQVIGNTAYLADGSSGLQVLDVTDPANITLLGSFDTDGEAWGLEVIDDFAYIADNFSGLKILDVSDPGNITSLGSFDTDDASKRVQVIDGVAYLADRFSGLKILDVSDPSDITLLGSFDTDHAALDVQVIDGIAYLADQSSGLQVLDVNDPADVTSLGSFDTDGNALGLDVVENLVYLADGSSRFLVLELTKATQAAGTIADDDSAKLSIDDVTLSEGDDGTKDFTFTVTLDEAVEDGFTVDYATADDSAKTTDSDYSSTDGTLTFDGAKGETQTIKVSVAGDEIVEADETFFVNLSNLQASGLDVSIDDGQGEGTITNDDTATLTLAGVNAQQDEGTGGTTTDFTFSVTLDNAVAGGFDLAYTTDDGTATTEDDDYVDNDGTLEFTGTAGEMKTITVKVNHDDEAENNEVFNVALGAISKLAEGIDTADVTTSGSPQTGTITNDDIGVSISDISLPEDLGQLGFVVSLNETVSSDVTVDFTTATDSADADDFTATSGEVTIKAGKSMTTILVEITEDMTTEPDEQFFVNISNLQGGGGDVTIADNQAVGTITNDDSLLVTALGPGSAPIVRAVHGPTDTELFEITAYDSAFTGGVRVATGDVNGDGTPDIITGPGPGGGPHIRVFDGTNPENELTGFFAMESSFSGGVFVASADLNQDGHDDIIVSAGAGGAPIVRAFSGDGGGTLFDFLAYSPGFTGGVRVAAGDISGDGTPDIITAAGPGGGPHVRVFDGSTPQLGGGVGTDIGGSLGSFFPYSSGFTGGVFVAAGDVNGDQHIDLITGAGKSGGPHVRVFDGDTGSQMAGAIGGFFAYDPAFQGGVRVATTDVDFDGRADVITTPGSGGGPHLQIFDGGSTGSTPDVLQGTFVGSPDFTGGVFVAGSMTLGSIKTLRLADGFSSATEADSLTQSEVKPVFDAALARLESAGLSSEVSETLSTLTIDIVDLSGDRLGAAVPGGILLDIDAAGLGWFVDPTPLEDQEFSGETLQAVDPQAANRVDLLTVLFHELAHQLGGDHADAGDHAGHLLAETLAPGTRRLPKPEELDELFADASLLGDLLN